MKQRRATLALGGGGARGVAHLGAIEELLKARIHPDRIVGVSIGGLAGALYAFEPDIVTVQQRALEYLLSPQFVQHQRRLLGAPRPPNAPEPGVGTKLYDRVTGYVRANQMLYRAVRRRSFVPGSLLEEVVNHLVPDADIADAPIPLSIIAVDLHTGRPVVFEKGPLRLAVRASASVAGVFPPIEHGNQLLCDIGSFYSLPVGIAREYSADMVVAVDVESRLKPLAPNATALDVLIRMNEIGGAMFHQQMSAAADLVIVPDVGHIPWFDFSTSGAVVEAGREAARAALAAEAAAPNWIQRLFAKTLHSLAPVDVQRGYVAEI
jgi:NTE family protein